MYSLVRFLRIIPFINSFHLLDSCSRHKVILRIRVMFHVIFIKPILRCEFFGDTFLNKNVEQMSYPCYNMGKLC